MKKNEKDENWFYRNLLLITIGVFAVLVGLKFFCPSTIDWLENKLDLEFYHILGFAGAIATLFWTNKRIKKVDRQHEQTLKQYQQTEDNAFLGKVNAIYLEAVKVLSDKESRVKKPKNTSDEELKIFLENQNYLAKNLISSIQASIDSYYQNKDEEEKNKIRRKMLNFSSMNLSYVNLQGNKLQGVDLTGTYLREASLQGAVLTGAKLQGTGLEGVDLQEAYLHGADLQRAYLIGAYLRGTYLTEANLRWADLRGADLQGVKFFEASVRGTDFTEAKNIDKAIYLHKTKNLDQAIGIPEPLYSQLLKDWEAYWDEKGGHPKR